MPHDIIIDITLEDDFLSDVMWTAFDGQYGGSLPWAIADDYKINRPDECGDSCADGILASVVVTDREGTDEGDPDFENLTVDHAVLVKGIERLIAGNVQVSPSILTYVREGVLEKDAGNIDSIAADCIVQAGLFGEIIYG